MNSATLWQVLPYAGENRFQAMRSACSWQEPKNDKIVGAECFVNDKGERNKFNAYDLISPTLTENGFFIFCKLSSFLCRVYQSGHYLVIFVSPFLSNFPDCFSVFEVGWFCSKSQMDLHSSWPQRGWLCLLDLFKSWHWPGPRPPIITTIMQRR